LPSGRGVPRGGHRLDLVATLRAAAPWQTLRRAGRHVAAGMAPRIEVRQDDFRIRRFRRNAHSTTIFAVDASGSTALNRLAEAKGAVELLLADCYVRRDSVALIAFRREAADVLLPPTRSLVRAKRCLAGLPGGGATPLAAGIEAARLVADGARRKGETAIVVLVTDGRANVGNAGRKGRAAAEADALQAARIFAGSAARTILIDVSPRSEPFARTLSDAMAARYVSLPHAGSAAMSEAVRREQSR
jgi:magnesium chelatase subunit D